ncbi:MAG: hypothetical protein N2439_14760, partial [Anaerolineae bacterium]|nr:hypothetical protein [Anaerolineae bacterium]
MRVNVEPSFAAEYFGSRQEFDIEAGNVFQLVEKLDHLGSGFAEIAEVRVIFAVDGTVANDWSVPLSPASEVFVIPRIGGG